MKAETIESKVADAIRDTLISPNEADSNLEPANLVDGIYNAGRMVSRALDRLGNADASTPMGGLEAHGQAILEAGERIAMALSEVAAAIEGIADQMRKMTP